ncbi:MAG: UDP-2,4-diacetamido-2,4,6-trideoxy-beta-L-altropyranose hydrolase [Thermodesulfobacteriota bacterium]|nr:UDP-2,4-diacetamido-2,4,6-trideoxy-beta-L-altropyranose hydrolase [Thermodesulfobacteriota bacterium]
MKRVFFRLDAHARIGTGHLMRCLAVAKELGCNGFLCHFLCRGLPPLLHARVIDQGHILHTVANEDSAVDLISEYRPDWLVIDHYGLDAGFEKKVAPFSQSILVIDDLADRPHHCHLLLDQGPLRTPHDYRPWVDRQCRLCLGTDYALVAPEFRRLSKPCVTSWEKGLICLGGADPENVALAVLHALDRAPGMRRIRWTVIAGSANPHWEALEGFAAHSRLNIVLTKHSDGIAALLANHDFAIGAAGGMTWERACIGIPTLAIPIAKNQTFGAEVIRHFGFGETLEVSELTPIALLSSLKRLEKNAHVYLRRSQAMVDGLGIWRLSKIMMYHNHQRGLHFTDTSHMGERAVI